MGVGMLALPRAMASAGFFGGTALLLLSAVLSTFSSHLLAECVDGVGRPAALSRVTARALGRPGVVLTEAAVVIVGTSAAIGYLIVVGDMLPEVKRWVVGAADPGSSGVWDSRELWICAALPVIVPLGYLRRLDSLRFASFLVVLAVLLIVVTVVLFAAEPAPLFDPCAVEEERRRLYGDAVDAAAAAAPPPPPPCRGTVVPTRRAAHARRAAHLPVRVRLPDQRTVDRVGAPRADAPADVARPSAAPRSRRRATSSSPAARTPRSGRASTPTSSSRTRAPRSWRASRSSTSSCSRTRWCRTPSPAPSSR